MSILHSHVYISGNALLIRETNTLKDTKSIPKVRER